MQVDLFSGLVGSGIGGHVAGLYRDRNSTQELISVPTFVEDTSLVHDVAMVGWLAMITAVALSRLHAPVVAGLLVAGAFFGPEGAGLITDADGISTIADIGVLLPLFGIELEFSLDRLCYIWRSVAIGGAFQVGLTAAAVLVALLLIGDTVQRALLFGFVVALSSTAIMLRPSRFAARSMLRTAASP